MNAKWVSLTVVLLMLISLFTIVERLTDTPVMGLQAQTRTVSFKQNDGFSVQTENKSEKNIYWDEEFIHETDTIFESLGGNLRVNARLLWVRDSCFRDAGTSKWYLSEGDTQFYRNILQLKFYKNGILTFEQQYGTDLFSDLTADDVADSLIRMKELKSVLFNNKHGQVYINVGMDIPYAGDEQAGYLIFNEKGEILTKGIGGVCDGGWELSDDGAYLLTSSEVIETGKLTRKSFQQPMRKIWHLSMINDTAFTLIYDPKYGDSEMGNAYIMTVTGDTLFNFIYTDLSADNRTGVGKLNGGHITLFFDASLGEVIIFRSDNFTAPEYFLTDDLVNFSKDIPPTGVFKVTLEHLGFHFYFNAQMKLIGYSENDKVL